MYKPMVDKDAAHQMNLTVLRRLDPAVEELLATAGHVALYDFDIPTKKWSRKDVEGSLFLVKRRSQPRFQFIILNKKSADNFVEDVMGNFQCEVNKPYLLYRNKNSEVVGIWFYDDDECDRISALLQRIATTFAAPTAAGIGIGIGAGQADGVRLGGPGAGAAAAAATPPGAHAAGGGPQPAGWRGGEVGAGAGDGGGGGDDGFWDRQVEVPSEVGMPVSAQASTSTAAHPQQQQQQQQPQHAQHAQQEAPASSAASAMPAPAGADNSLMRIFAGMKVTPQAQQAQQAQRAGASGAGTHGVLPLLSPMAAPALTLPPGSEGQQAQAPPAGAPITPLLTPQFLKQAAAAAPAAPAGPPPAPLPQQAQQTLAPQAIEGAGQALLKQLQMRPPSQAPAAAAAVAPLAAPAAPPVAPPAPPAATDIIGEAAERVLHGKVRAFLRGLADNEAFVDIVAAELRKAGLL